MNPQDPFRPRQMHFRLETSVGRQSGPITKIVGAVLAVAVFAAGLFLSVFVFLGLLAVGVTAGGWIWWRTRGLRRQLKETLKTAEDRLAAARSEAERRPGTASDAGPGRPGESTIIDGDYIRPKNEPPAR